MPIYRMDAQIQSEVDAHARVYHPSVGELKMRVSHDGHIVCKEPLCLWVSTRTMDLSPNNPTGEN